MLNKEIKKIRKKIRKDERLFLLIVESIIKNKKIKIINERTNERKKNNISEK